MKSLAAQHMEEEARAFAAKLKPRAGAATIVALSGELGAGKTTFVKGIAKALGITEHVTSPTFVIMKIYDSSGGKFERLVHIDAYRLKGIHHLNVLGWDELLRDQGNLILIEWPEKIAKAVPSDAISLAFRYSGDEREIIYGEETDTNE